MKKVWTAIIISVTVVCLSACKGHEISPVSITSTSSFSESKVSLKEKKSVISVSEEQENSPLLSTINPITGLPREEDLSQGQRPVAVMVGNDAKALPQRGLAAADLMYEMGIEAGKTQLMAVYSDYKKMQQVGPVFQAKDQFIQLALPQEFILQHIGATVYGENLLVVENEKTVDGFSLGTTAFKFDNDRLINRYGHRGVEYCWFTDAGLLWSGMERIDIFTTAEKEHSAFNFSAEQMQPKTDAYLINAVYSANANSSFEYDETAGVYNKNILGLPHTDEDGTRLSYTNVFLLNINVGVKEDGQLPDFDFSKGSGYYFTKGSVQKIQWHKGAPNEELQFTDEQGNVLKVQPGKSYVGFLPANVDFTTIEYFAKPPVEQTESLAQEQTQSEVQSLEKSSENTSALAE